MKNQQPPETQAEPVDVTPTPPTDIMCNPGMLIAKALDANVGIETLERLFALREKMVREQAERAFNLAFSLFQAECPVIGKSQTAGKEGGYGYKYASLDIIKPIIAPLLARHSLSYSIDYQFGDDGVTAICTLMHADGHSRSSCVKVPVDKKDRMNDTQKVGSACSYASRYALVGVAGLVCSKDDDDAQTAHRPPQSRTEPAKASSAASTPQNGAGTPQARSGGNDKAQGVGVWLPGFVGHVKTLKTGTTSKGVAWQQIGIKLDGTQYSTFDTGLADFAVKWCGREVLYMLERSKDDKYLNLKDLKEIDPSGPDARQNYPDECQMATAPAGADEDDGLPF